MTLPFTGEYRNGDMVQCQRCAKNVRVKYYDRDAVVVVSSQEQQTLALRCQYCGYVLCDSCAHPADSLFPVCPSCQREWGPYYFTHEVIMPSLSKAALTEDVPAVSHAQPALQPTLQPAVQTVVTPPPPEALSSTVDTLGAGETDLFGEYRSWERKALFRKILASIIVLIFVGLLIFLALGPGKPYVKKGLSLIGTRPTRTPSIFALAVNSTASPTKTPEKTSPPVTKAAIVTQIPSATSPSATATKTTVATKAAPTATLTIYITASPEPSQTVEPTSTPADIASPDCKQALSVTLDDVGKKICVTGTVVFTSQIGTAFSIYFSNDDGYFRIVIYDRVPTDIKAGVCIRVTGEIKTLTGIPVMALGYFDVIEFCTP